jgi:hypothetical protein
MLTLYLELGFDHISDLKGYDHILFIIALCASYSITDWRRLLILVTAFTLGHSFTLALSALHVVNLPSGLIEFLIPCTIFCTALLNIWYKPEPSKKWNPIYFLALFFGFIHGLGFASYFKALLGREASIIVPLLGFNLGVELGQLCIVAVILFVNFLFIHFVKITQRQWNIPVSVISAVLSIVMIIQRA